MTDLLVGLDVGTSTVKARLVDLSGTEVAGASQPMPWSTVRTGAQATLPEVRTAAWATLHQLLDAAPTGRVVGIGVTGIAEAGVLLDDHGAALTPIIAWHDSRGGEAADRLASDLGAERFAAATGLPISATPTIAKLSWIQAHTDWFAPARRWLGVPEAIAHLLGGDAVADLSLACRTGMLDLETRTWWDEAIDWLRAPQALLPDVVPSGTAIGAVRGPDLPPQLQNAVVTVGGHDHLTAAFGAGAVESGDVFDSCGTAEALIAATSPLSRDAVLAAVDDGLNVSWHVEPDRQALVAALPTGLFLGRIRHLLGQPVEVLDRLESESAPDARPIRFSDLDGDPAHLAEACRGHGPATVWTAATEAATDRVTRLLDTMRGHGAGKSRLIATGGWTNCASVLEAKRARLGPLVVPEIAEAGAFGAALMAGVAAEVFPTTRDVPRPQYVNPAMQTRQPGDR